MEEADYGTVVSTKDAVLLQDAELPSESGQESNDISSVGNALWSYLHENRINGIPVKNGDCNLPIERDDMLSATFQLVSVPKSMLLWLSPDDAEAIAKYDDLLQRVYNGTVIIQDEVKQYDAAKGKFIVWVRYNEVYYELHPRFQYLREEVQ